MDENAVQVAGLATLVLSVARGDSLAGIGRMGFLQSTPFCSLEAAVASHGLSGACCRRPTSPLLRDLLSRAPALEGRWALLVSVID